MYAGFCERLSAATRVQVRGGGSKGIPIGNLTSQLFANVYLNELDQFIKHGLKVKKYARYTDDFVIVSHNRNYLEKMIFFIEKRGLNKN